MERPNGTGDQLPRSGSVVRRWVYSVRILDTVMRFLLVALAGYLLGASGLHAACDAAAKESCRRIADNGQIACAALTSSSPDAHAQCLSDLAGEYQVCIGQANCLPSQADDEGSTCSGEGCE